MPWRRSTIDFRNRIHDAETPRADHCRALRVAYTRYPTGSTDRYQPAATIKGNPLPRAADAKAPFPSKLGIITILVLLLASLATLPLEHLSQLLHSFSSKLFSVIISDVKEKLRVDRKQKSIQAATHDPVFGRARVVSLDIVRDVPLYRGRIMSAISCACAHSSSASSRTAMR
jgi:hypothetical protein